MWGAIRKLSQAHLHAHGSAVVEVDLVAVVPVRSRPLDCVRPGYPGEREAGTQNEHCLFLFLFLLQISTSPCFLVFTAYHIKMLKVEPRHRRSIAVRAGI